MLGKATLKHHAGLVDSMAETVGVDLEEAIMKGQMTVDQLSDAVLSCTGCSETQACEHWLARQTEIASEAPGYCRNGDTFRRLFDGKHA